MVLEFIREKLKSFRNLGLNWSFVQGVPFSKWQSFFKENLSLAVISQMIHVYLYCGISRTFVVSTILIYVLVMHDFAHFVREDFHC